MTISVRYSASSHWHVSITDVTTIYNLDITVQIIFPQLINNMTATEKKNRDMIKAIVTGRAKSNGEAYAMSRGKEKHTNSDSAMASRLLKNVKVQEYMQRMRNMYLTRSAEAFERQWQLAEQPTTPPHVKNAIWDKVQDRAGLGGIEMQLHQHQVKFSDMQMTVDQVRALLDEPKKITANV